MNKILKPGVKAGVVHMPNHFKFVSEANRMFVAREYQQMTNPLDGVVTFMPLRGKTMVKPETLQRRKLKEAMRAIA